MQWWNPTQLYFGDYFISHEIRIPAWTNQDSMEFRNVIRKNRAPTSYKMELWCPYKWGKNQWVCLGVPTSGVKLTKRTLLNWPQSPISRLPTSLTLQHVLCLFGWWSANGIPRNPTKCLRINEGRKTGWVNLSTVEDHRIFQFFEKWHKRRVQELFGGEFQSGRFFKRTSGARFWILGGTRKFCSHLHLNRPFGIGDQLQMSSPCKQDKNGAKKKLDTARSQADRLDFKGWCRSKTKKKKKNNNNTSPPIHGNVFKETLFSPRFSPDQNLWKKTWRHFFSNIQEGPSPCINKFPSTIMKQQFCQHQVNLFPPLQGSPFLTSLLLPAPASMSPAISFFGVKP